MSKISTQRVSNAGKLLQNLLKKVDNGDEVLTEFEIHKLNKTHYQRGSRVYVTGAPGKQQFDPATEGALIAAINKVKSRSERSLDGIISGVGEAALELKQANLDRDGYLSDDEQKKVKSKLGKSLLEFARVHGGDSVSDFKIKVPLAKVYVPKRAFAPPANATAKAMVEALVKHFNDFGNDNHVGLGSRVATRYVLSTIETQGVAAAIAKLPAATAKATLRELSRRIKQADPSGPEFEPKRIYVQPKAVPILDKLAKSLGVRASFVGVAKAPSFNFY